MAERLTPAQILEPVLEALEAGGAATSSRDYGRGVAHAARVMRAALEGSLDHDLLRSCSWCGAIVGQECHDRQGRPETTHGARL